MVRNLDSTLQLWTQPVPNDDSVAVRAFAERYTDPVLINGSSFTCLDLVQRARAQQRAFSDLRIEILQRVDTPEHTVIAFRQIARHTGPLATPLGDVPASGRDISRMVMDILKFENGRVSEVHVVGDELGLLVALGAVKLA